MASSLPARAAASRPGVPRGQGRWRNRERGEKGRGGGEGGWGGREGGWVVREGGWGGQCCTCMTSNSLGSETPGNEAVYCLSDIVGYHPPTSLLAPRVPREPVSLDGQKREGPDVSVQCM